jgi:hypothetical protein
MAGGVNVLLSTGIGLTVTTTLFILVHPLAVIVYTYVTLIGAAVVLVSVSLIPATKPVVPASAIPATAARDHENPEPAVRLVAV